MRNVLHAEYTKLRSVAGPRWLLLGTVLLTVVPGAAITSVFGCPDGECAADPVQLALTGIYLGQVPVVILGVLVIGGEYATGTIRAGLAALPRRSAVLAGKAAVVAGGVAVAAGVAVGGSLLIARWVLPAETLSLTDGPTARAAIGTVGYLVLIGWLALGIATAVRDSATSLGVVLALLYVFPVAAQAVGDPGWRRLLDQVGPMTAGLSVQATTGVADLPIGPWAGLAVTGGWAAVALAAGGTLLCRRDA